MGGENPFNVFSNPFDVIIWSFWCQSLIQNSKNKEVWYRIVKLTWSYSNRIIVYVALNFNSYQNIIAQLWWGFLHFLTRLPPASLQASTSHTPTPAPPFVQVFTPTVQSVHYTSIHKSFQVKFCHILLTS